MTPDPRSLLRIARRVTKKAAGRISGVDAVRAELATTKDRLVTAKSDLAKGKARLARAKSDLGAARDQVATAKNDLGAAKSDLATAKNDLAKERAQLATAKGDLATAKGQQSTTKERLRDARSQRDTARGRAKEFEAKRAAATDRARGLGYGYRGLRAAALGMRRPSDLGDPPGRVSPELRKEHEIELSWIHRRSSFTESLATGHGLERGIEELVRSAKGMPQITEARQIAQWLYDNESTRSAGALGTGLIAQRMGLPDFAWDRLSTLPDGVWLQHAPSEYVLLAGQLESSRAQQAVQAALAHSEPMSTQTWLGLARRAMGLDLGELCTDLAQRFEQSALADLASGELAEDEVAALERDRAWIARWAPRIAAGHPPPTLAPEGAVPIGVLGYDQPDPRNTSSNIGDYVQTIASMSHLVRHTGTHFDESALGQFASDLAERVPADLRVKSPETKVALYQVDRDASSYSAVPDGTWLLAFGWYAHKIGGVRHDLPFPKRVRPIYISFHLNKRDLLTREEIEHLHAHAPIGCRDHSTVDLLLGLDIPAFFSGCLTTTVRYVRPDDAPSRPADAPTVHIDLPDPEGGIGVRNERPEVAQADMETNLRAALTSLDEYTSEIGTVVTGRLHSYLPARALGCTVDFSPRNPSDIRFAGLSPLTDDEVYEMGRGVGDLLEPVFAAILAGEDEEHVRGVWSEATARHVTAALERQAKVVELPAIIDVAEVVATIRAAQVDVPRRAAGPSGKEMEIVLALDGNLKDQFLVVVDGMVEHATRPVHLNVLVRDHHQPDFDRAEALFPTVSFSWFPCDEVSYGDIHAMIPHITISTMDRLVLPQLLTDVDRVVYHDIDALPMDDIAELYEIDLQGHPLAARDLEASTMRSGYTHIFQPAALKQLAPGMGSELIRRETARHPFDFVGFNAGIMVLDLARMRADDFCQRFLPYANNFGMHDQQILNVYVGADRLSLAPEWNARPSQENVENPKIIHWAGGQKPWVEGYVSYKDAWSRHVDSLARREAAMAQDGVPGPWNTQTLTRESVTEGTV